MKDHNRKCLKCGNSPANDPSVKLFRFPQPGVKNPLRCELWAKFCFPDQECPREFQIKLYTEHRMLCDRHFKPSSFIDFATKKLHRHAVPHSDVKRVVIDLSSVTPGPSTAETIGLSKMTAGPSMHQPLPHPDVKRVVIDMSSVTPGPSTAETIGSSKVTAGPSMHQPVIMPDPPSQQPDRGKQDYFVCENTQIASNKETQLYIKCRKYMKKVCQLRNQIKKFKNKAVLKTLENDSDVNALVKNISPALALLLQGEIKNFKRKIKGRRWTQEQKITALRLYKRSPTCYNLLRRLFCLPAPGTLKVLLSQFPVSVGINPKIFKVLNKFTGTQQPSDNEYILAFDEMSIRKHLDYNRKDDKIDGYQDHGDQGRSPAVATHALVFMLCAIRKKLKQPVAFYLSGSSVTADRLSVLIKEVLLHCFNANINVTTTVCDLDGVNRKALGLLGATSQNPCMNIHKRKIITIFDPPHLLKCFRNLFMKYDIKCSMNISDGDKTGTGLAKWSHIKDFYEIDNANPNFVFAPTLKQEHLTPNAKQKMRVKLAAQIFSHSVAAGMFCKISQGELPADATVTANLVTQMDKLFDCLNSDTPDLRRGKPHATNLREKTPHLQLFDEMKQFFSSLEFIGCRSKPPSIEGWIWTLNAITMYWRDLKKRHPTVKSLSTRRLQQDPLENLFGCIRGHCGSNTNPTAVQFIAGLKTAFLSSLASAGFHGGNCEKDDNTAILENFKILLEPKPVMAKDTVQDSCSHFDLKENIDDSFEQSMEEVNGEIQACAYVCGFIIKKYKNECMVCRKSLISDNIELEHNFLETREYSDLKKSLHYASRHLINIVEYCASTINKYLEENSHLEKLQHVGNLLKNANFDFLKCNTHKEYNVKYITRSVFYICIKRFCVLKNRKFIEEASASSLRKKINILKHV